MHKILIATTNPAKIDRYTRYFNNIGYNCYITTLIDLNLSTSEPLETGSNEIENSKIKALHYLKSTNFDGLIFSEDTGMRLLDVDPKDNPGKDIKKPVLEKYGNIDPENMVNYYSELATKYGGKITQEWTYGFTIANKNNIRSTQTSSISYLVSKIKQPIQEGHPLGAICLVDEVNSKYWNEMSNDEKYQFFDNKAIKIIQDLLTPFIN